MANGVFVQLTAKDTYGFDDLSKPGSPLDKLGIQHGDMVRLHATQRTSSSELTIALE